MNANSLDIYSQPYHEFYIIDFLEGNIKVKLSLEAKDKINQELSKKYGSIQKAANIIGFKYWQMK